MVHFDVPKLDDHKRDGVGIADERGHKKKVALAVGIFAFSN